MARGQSAGCQPLVRRVEAPVLLQEYVAHHGGTMLKGYCVGRRVHVAQRASLPDLVGGAAGPAGP